VSGAAPRIVPLGEAAWTVVLGDTVDRALHHQVMELAERIGVAAIPGVVEVVPAYAALTVFFDPLIAASQLLRDRLAELALQTPGSQPVSPEPITAHPCTRPPAAQLPPPVTIPVVYDGPDLLEVSQQTGVSRESVIRMHSEREYFVYMLGFVPGFAYLGDLHPALVIPRRSSPRTRVPAGSVAIAGGQTAVYPLTTPGGWHLIGSTPLLLFDPRRNPPSLLTPGARVRFEPVP
jgi:KipI family sensor histidine kinase inhibitor